LELFFENLEKLAELESLELSFFNCQQLTDAGMDMFYHGALTPFTKLKQLSWHFRDCERIAFDDVQINILQHPNYSDSWSVRFSSKDDPRINSDLLTPSKILTFSREIDFKDSNVGARQQYKADISLNLNHKEIIKDLPSSLESLALNIAFKETTEITENDKAKIIEEVLQGLKGFPQMKELDINFSNILADKAIDILATEGYHNLLKLRVHLDQASKVTDESIRSLVEKGFKQLPRLQSLIFDFSCAGITEKGFNFLIQEGIHQLEDLTYLEIYLGPNTRHFYNFYNHAEKLKVLGLKFHGRT